MKTFYSHGKLLLTSEYVILDGSLGLALPTQKGQFLTINSINNPKLVWKSLDYKGSVWFEETFDIEDTELKLLGNKISDRLINVLNAAKQLNPNFLSNGIGYEVTSSLEFPGDWGLGSSSTLINNIANWAEIDAFNLLDKTFGGSGYDVACAQNSNPISYQINNANRDINSIAFCPSFKDNLYFVHLNKKQNSRDGIAHYKANRSNLKETILKITAITKLIINCESLMTFQGLIDKHEDIISKVINKPTVKETFFKDFKGSIKSLGAWGGDFVLVASAHNSEDYFKKKGYNTFIPYSKMILKQ